MLRIFCIQETSADLAQSVTSSSSVTSQYRRGTRSGSREGPTAADDVVTSPSQTGSTAPSTTPGTEHAAFSFFQIVAVAAEAGNQQKSVITPKMFAVTSDIHVDNLVSCPVTTLCHVTNVIASSHSCYQIIVVIHMICKKR